MRKLIALEMYAFVLGTLAGCGGETASAETIGRAELLLPKMVAERKESRARPAGWIVSLVLRPWSLVEREVQAA
jgi:hypothetical protein